MILKNVWLIVAVFLVFITGFAAAAAAGKNSGHGSGHAAAAAAPKVILGTQNVDNIQATAEIADVRAAMAKAGQPMTHHLQVSFTEPPADKPLETGVVAVKVTLPSGTEEEARQLVGKDGHFGVDLVLKTPGLYRFAVGTRLADGLKRQFIFEYKVP